MTAAATPDDSNGSDDRDPLRSIRAMIAAAPLDALLEVARALQNKLNQPESAAARRVAELGLLAVCLDEQPQDPWLSPRVTAEFYDEQRNRRAPHAPSAETLARRYGSWKRACYAAYGVRIDGSKSAPGDAWASGIPGKAPTKACTRDECIESVRLCAREIGRRPSSSAYAEWRANRRARMRAAGETARIASVRRILKLLAPRRGERDGWRIVLGVVFDS